MLSFFLNFSIEFLPLKSSVYAIVIALMSKEMMDPVNEIIEKLSIDFQNGLNQGDNLLPQMVLYFYGALLNIGSLNTLDFISILFDLTN